MAPGGWVMGAYCVAPRQPQSGQEASAADGPEGKRGDGRMGEGGREGGSRNGDN